MAVNITYFVHGTTTDNDKGIATGQNPGELSELGREQSIKLKEFIKDQKYDVIFCSDLKRAVDSAHLMFRYNVIEDERLRECNYGNLNGSKGELDLLMYVDDAFPNGESLKDVENRIKYFLKYLLENYDGKNIAIVAHQAPQLALDVLINGKTWEQAIKEDWRKTKGWKPGWKYELR